MSPSSCSQLRYFLGGIVSKVPEQDKNAGQRTLHPMILRESATILSSPLPPNLNQHGGLTSCPNIHQEFGRNDFRFEGIESGVNELITVPYVQTQMVSQLMTKEPVNELLKTWILIK